MKLPFNPHPQWRNHFDYKESFPAIVNVMIPDPVIEATIELKYEPDPIIEKFSGQKLTPPEL